MKPLYKTTIVIWSEFNGNDVELSHLAREAEEGAAYCSRSRSELISDPAADEAWDGTEFFGVDEDTRTYDERREGGEGIVACPECGTDEWDFTADRRARCKNGHEWEQQPDLPGTFVRPGYPGDINDPERFPGEDSGCE